MTEIFNEELSDHVYDSIVEIVDCRIRRRKIEFIIYWGRNRFSLVEEEDLKFNTVHIDKLNQFIASHPEKYALLLEQISIMKAGEELRRVPNSDDETDWD
ncbi:unnamed protein product [Auanema sp. JU1783]|nr:unnamed protein product [Auanema sp. JU1783]